MDVITTHFDSISNNSQQYGELLDYREFYLMNKNTIIKVNIGRKEKSIIIKSTNYVISCNSKELSTLFGSNFKSNDTAYQFIIDSFEENKFVVKHIIINKELQLIYKKNDKNKEENIAISLIYNPDNKDFNYIELNNQYIHIKKQFAELKKENLQLKEELNLLKSYYKNETPKDIHVISDLTEDAYSDDISDNTLTVFKSIQDIFYLIYSNKKKSIICHNLIEQKRVIEIKNCHNEYITNFRHYFDEKNKRDLIISISYADKNIKLWNVLKWECLTSIANIYVNGYLYSACFLEAYNYILTSNSNLYGDSGPIKVYDFSGQKITEIDGSNENTSFINTFYDKKTSTTFVLTGNSNYVKSYDYDKNEVFRKYSDNYNNNHLSIIISNTEEDEVRLIESCYDGNIRVWDFYSGLLLNKIKIGDNWLYGICLWNTKYLFVGCSDKTIKLIDLKEEYIVKSFKGHNNSVLTIKKINHPQYGECLITQGYNDDPIKLWINKN